MARIISIIDAFDVMTHRQQNKPAMTKEEALQALNLKVGSQLDPSLVQLFVKMVNEISDTKE